MDLLLVVEFLHHKKVSQGHIGLVAPAMAEAEADTMEEVITSTTTLLL